MDYETLAKKAASVLTDIFESDMSTAEKQICELFYKNGLLTREKCSDDGEVVYHSNTE